MTKASDEASFMAAAQMASIPILRPRRRRAGEQGTGPTALTWGFSMAVGGRF